MRRMELARGSARSLINQLCNGEQPYTDAEAAENGIDTNVNFLHASKIAHDMRSTLNNGFIKPGYFFTASTDSGPAHRRRDWGATVTKNVNRPMKRSAHYLGTQRDTFAQMTLHGIGPVNWPKKACLYPDSIAICDILVPSSTKVNLENLNHFAIHRKYTPAQLYSMTHGAKIDRGWNMQMVRTALKRIKENNTAATPWNELDNPEKLTELFKANLGYYESDAVPTIGAWDFYYRHEDTENEEWCRRMVLDFEGETYNDKFLFNPGKRIYANSYQELVHFQFADCSNVAPFLYHTVRSLGWLLYAVCHLQNRMGCKFSDAVFEQMMWFFRTSMNDDRERIEKVDLHNMGLIPDGLAFITAQERFTPNVNLINAGMEFYRGIMRDNSSSFLHDTMESGEKDPTATYTMSKVNASAALISAMLNLAYTYQTFQYQEIFRRFCIKDSPYREARKFQENCLRDGVPKEMLDPERWDIEPEKIIGSGNKMLEITMADKLMAAYQLYEPDSQRMILHIYTEANTDDPKLAETLVPLKRQGVSDTIHDAQLSAATLMMGLPLSVKQGINHGEYFETLMQAVGIVIDEVTGTGGNATKEQIIGIQNTILHAEEHLKLIAQNKGAKAQVKQFSDILARAKNAVKGFAQRFMEQQAKKNGSAEPSPEVIAKIAATKITAEAKAQNMREANALKLQIKQQGFVADQARKQQEHQLGMSRRIEETQVENASADLKTTAEILRENKKSVNEPKTTTE